MANVADYWWCAARTVIKSRKEEVGFFAAYIEDRLRYSLELGRIDRLPDRQSDWLEIEEDLTDQDREQLLRQRAAERKERRGFSIIMARQEGRTVYINPCAPAEDQLREIERARKHGLKVKRDDPLLRGETRHRIQAERYESIRWAFPWKEYVLVGVPDGITDRFTYEYKTTGKRGLVHYVRPVARAQACLYAYFFKRPETRVQIRSEDDGKTETCQEALDQRLVLQTLRSFRSVDRGASPKPPVAWKCKRCEFGRSCRVGAR
jgi:hypothetical protein